MPYVKFELDGRQQWGWTLYGANNAIIAWATGYNSKAGARKAFERTRIIMGEAILVK